MIIYLSMDDNDYESTSHEMKVAEILSKDEKLLVLTDRDLNYESGNMAVMSFPVNRGVLRRWDGAIRSLKFKRLLSRLAKTGKIEAIYATSISGADLAIQGRRYGIPAIVQVLDVPVHLLSQKKVRSEWNYWVKHLRYCDTIIANDQTTKDDLIAFARGQGHLFAMDIRIVHYGINTDIFDAVPEQPEADQMLIISRLVAHKSVDMLIEATALARDPPKLVIIGGGSERKKLEELAARHWVNCVFLGRVSDAVKAEQIKKSKFTVFTSTAEHIAGLPPAESLYCGKACICFDVPILRNLYHWYVDYVPVGDVTALAKKIEHLNFSNADRYWKGKFGKEFVKENLTSEVHARAVLRCIRECNGQ